MRGTGRGGWLSALGVVVRLVHIAVLILCCGCNLTPIGSSGNMSTNSVDNTVGKFPRSWNSPCNLDQKLVCPKNGHIDKRLKRNRNFFNIAQAIEKFKAFVTDT
jgi:hypothetical protein